MLANQEGDSTPPIGSVQRCHSDLYSRQQARRTIDTFKEGDRRKRPACAAGLANQGAQVALLHPELAQECQDISLSACIHQQQSARRRLTRRYNGLALTGGFLCVLEIRGDRLALLALRTLFSTLAAELNAAARAVGGCARPRHRALLTVPSLLT